MTHLIIIMVDEMRADVAYHEKYPFVQLSNLDALREESVTFEAAFCNYPVCAPSRASIYTGLYPHQHGVMNNRCMLPPDERTLGHHLTDNGYDAVAFGKTHGQNPGFRCVPEPAIEPSLGSRYWGWYASQSMLDTVAEATDVPEPIMYPFDKDIDEHYDYIVAKQVHDYLTNRDKSRPFALHIGIHTPHTPLIPPENVAGLYDDETIELHDVSEELAASKPQMQRATGKEFRRTPRDVREQMMRTYLQLNTHVDHVLGRLMQTFQDTGVLEDSVIVFVSDHGEQMGDFEMLGKFNNFYDASLRVPLVVRLPDKGRAGKTSSAMIELVDLYPTVCDLLNIAHPTYCAGQSFHAVLQQPAHAHREYVHAMLVEKSAHSITAVNSHESFDAGYMIRDACYKLALYAHDRGELYDVQSDPRELNNLYDHPDYQAIQLRLLEAMMKHNIQHRRRPTLWGYNHFPG